MKIALFDTYRFTDDGALIRSPKVKAHNKEEAQRRLRFHGFQSELEQIFHVGYTTEDFEEVALRIHCESPHVLVDRRVRTARRSFSSTDTFFNRRRKVKENRGSGRARRKGGRARRNGGE